jgi:hypothetical protein
VNTSINGTVFVYKNDEDDYHAKIVANVEIDPNDWGGVAIHFPEGMLVSNIDCSYPQEVLFQERKPNGYYDYIDVDYSYQKKYYSRVEIARNRDKIPSGGGSGTVLIDFDINKARFEDNDMSFLVCVGILETDSVEVNLETENQ